MGLRERIDRLDELTKRRRHRQHEWTPEEQELVRRTLGVQDLDAPVEVSGPGSDAVEFLSDDELWEIIRRG